jgi:hypothetical protein
MLTITFISGQDRCVISCDSYSVEHCTETGDIFVDVVKGVGEKVGTESFVVSSNSEDDWSVAYVTNLAGKTIDRIGRGNAE